MVIKVIATIICFMIVATVVVLTKINKDERHFILKRLLSNLKLLVLLNENEYNQKRISFEEYQENLSAIYDIVDVLENRL